MKIATARKMTSKNWVTKDIPWEELLQQLRTPLRTGETMREYKAMSREEKGYAKGAAGGFVGGALSCGQRKTENVTCRSMLTLDADNAYEGQWDSVTALHEFAMCCYSTHSSTPKAPRLRWIIPTDREMTPDEYPAVSRRVASWFGIDTFDSSTHELARLMFFPTVSKDDTMRILIGPENVAEELKDTSVVVASYDIGEGMKGVIGVVGPTRMDYAKVTAKLSYLADNLSKLFSAPQQTNLPQKREAPGLNPPKPKSGEEA